MPIFLESADYRQFLHLLGDIVESFDIQCWNYCLMPNHYHATLQPSAPNLSVALRRLNGRYAQWWNRRHGRVGHVFQGRFKNQLVQRETYLLELTRYVVMNPVRAGLVDHPEEWEWSSYRATMGLVACPPFVSDGATLSLFGAGDVSALRERLAEFVLRTPLDEGPAERIRSNERTLGDREFKIRVARSAGTVANGFESTAVPDKDLVAGGLGTGVHA